MINKPRHFVNQLSSYINFKYEFWKNCGSICKKLWNRWSMKNVIYENLNFSIPLVGSNPVAVPHSSLLKRCLQLQTLQILKVSKKLFQRLTGLRLSFLHRNASEKCKILTDILLNVFENFIPQKPKNLTIKIPIGWIDQLHYP